VQQQEMDMADIVILPGIGGSGETHWQTHWEKANPRMRRFQPKNWDRPDLNDWIAALDRAVGEAATPPLLIAHSLACLLVAHWQHDSSLSVTGAFLVAVPDSESDAFPIGAATFADTPKGRLRFPSLIVASSDDPYGKIDYAHARGRRMGKRHCRGRSTRPYQRSRRSRGLARRSGLVDGLCGWSWICGRCLFDFFLILKQRPRPRIGMA